LTYRARHWRHVILAGLLVMTGLGLFLTAWRSALGPWLPADQVVHEAGGVLYTLALVGWSARFFPWPGPARHAPPYARWGYFFLLMLGITGLGLLAGPSWTRSIATVGHAAFAAGFVVWAGWHLIRAWPARPRATRETPATGWQRRLVSRRRFLRWGVAAAVAVPSVLALPTMGRLVIGRTLGDAGGAGRDASALPGFVPYTVVNGYPRIPKDAWRLTLLADGHKKQWTFSEWDRLPKVHFRYTFHCVTGWAVPDVAVSGVNLERFLLDNGWEPVREPWVLFCSGDGVYTESMSAEQIHRFQPVMASTMEGRPLPVSQGYPVRLLVPDMYGYKSIKWLIGIRLAAHDQLGYWEVRGYPEDAYLGSYLNGF